MFSHQSLEFLKKHSYRISINDEVITLRYRSSDRLIVLVVGGICTIATVSMGILIPVYFVGTVLVIILAYSEYRKKIPSHSTHINFESSQFITSLPGGNSYLGRLSDIQEVLYITRFLNEYTSSFKNTSTEYLGQIIVQLKDDQEVKLFEFYVETDDVPKEMSDISQALKEG